MGVVSSSPFYTGKGPGTGLPQEGWSLMAQFVTFDRNVEVNGATIMSVVNGMGTFKEKGKKILEQHGLKDIQPEGWYPQQAWLDAFKAIAENYGEKTLESIGKAIPTSAKFPPDVDDIHKAIASIDKAYHMNHRNGEIGYYRYTQVSENSGVVECKNPYPSAFDRGIILGMARRLKPGARISLDTSKPTRTSGADSCTFIVQW